MKHLARIFSLLILVSAGLFFANCGGSDPDPKSEEETQLDKFKGTWNMSSVTFSGISPTDMTDEYAGMTVTFSGTFGSAGGSYSYTSGAPTASWPTPNAWKPADSWKFKTSSVGSVIIRDIDDLEMGYAFTNNNETLTIEIEDYTGESYAGRKKSVDGDWTFVFEKQ